MTTNKEQTQAPEFSLQNQNEETIVLSEVLKKHNVLLYFYPKDMTSGCTMESIGFSELKNKFLKQNVVVFGVSKDSVQSHKKFCDKSSLEIDLLSDPSGQMLETYGVWKEKSMFGKKYMGISRESFLIGQDGVIIKHWEKVNPMKHPQEVLDLVSSK